MTVTNEHSRKPDLLFTASLNFFPFRHLRKTQIYALKMLLFYLPAKLSWQSCCNWGARVPVGSSGARDCLLLSLLLMGITVALKYFSRSQAAAQWDSVKLGLYRFLKSSEGTLYDHSNGDYYPLYCYYHSVVQGWSEQASNRSLAYSGSEKSWSLKTSQVIPRKQGKRNDALTSMHGTANSSKKTHLSIVIVSLKMQSFILLKVRDF